MYYTFCSPEASYYIIRELLQRREVDYDDPLFDFSTPGLLHFFQKINDAKKWGRVGKYRFFRSHVLRKYHASNIGLPTEYIDALEGRSKNKVHDTYIKTNPEKLKEKYMECMGNVMIGAIPLEPSDFKPEPRRQMSSSTRKPNPAAPSGTVLDIIPNTTGSTMVTNSGNNSRVTRVIRSHGEVRRGQRKIRDTNKMVSFFSVG